MADEINPQHPDNRIAAQHHTTGAREHWEGVYSDSQEHELPWFSDALDQDFVRALETLGLHPEDGPVLDVGTGPGTVARELARRGYHVTAMDISQGAIDMAKRRAGDLAEKIAWRVDNVTTTDLAGPFAFAHDRGCFHVLDDDDRARYVTQLARLIRPGGRLFLKTFSKKQPGEWGPRRYTPEEIQEIFLPHFAVIQHEYSSFPGPMEPLPIANFCVLLRAGGR